MVGAADPHLHARHRAQAGDCAAVRVTYVSLLKAFQRNPDGALILCLYYNVSYGPSSCHSAGATTLAVSRNVE